MELDPSSVLCCALTEDKSHFGIGTKNGFQIFDCRKGVNSVLNRNIFETGIKHLAFLATSSIFVFVGDNKQQNSEYGPNKVVIWDDIQMSPIMEIQLLSKIYQIRINKNFLFVVTKKAIYVIDFEQAKTKHLFLHNSKSLKNKTIFDICYPEIENQKIAYPDLNKHIICIKTIEFPEYNFGFSYIGKLITFLKFNKMGTWLGVISDNILVCIYDLIKRGVKQTFTQTSSVQCLEFSNDNNLLITICNDGSVNFFKIHHNPNTNYLRKIKQNIDPFFKDYIMKGKYVCGFNKENIFIVVSSEGFITKYKINTISCECEKKKSYSYSKNASIKKEDYTDSSSDSSTQFDYESNFSSNNDLEIELNNINKDENKHESWVINGEGKGDEKKNDENNVYN
ncbi:wd-repeat protein interacting with phosphoinosides wipi -related [Anaeramoeba flamelloides]|uniref:Wd-repeat protein interacting with phosphoinosides wipi -related n=1 Tax=Anaeramoeba flamelloides TaxID=1746091 RepID=A0AAV7YVF7_9EUKA|nr:wd-repeat protein interacting with phosphoinosides wipi -related [Anaeramoeba flamelloides]